MTLLIYEIKKTKMNKKTKQKWTQRCREQTGGPGGGVWEWESWVKQMKRIKKPRLPIIKYTS